MKKINDIIISSNSPALNNVGWVKTEEDKLTLKFHINGKWKSINEGSGEGGSTYELPQATVDTLGGVRLGRVGNVEYVPLTTIMGTGVDVGAAGVYIDSAYFKIDGIDKSMLSLRHHFSLEVSKAGGLSVALGTDNPNLPAIPCVIGTKLNLDSSIWKPNVIGIPYNQEQFCLKNNGLNLVDGIGSATKVTWDSNSDMNDYIAAGVYDITGTRESLYDSLPIANIGENATIAARLIVTVTPEGATTYRHSIGQTLILSNAEGKETKVYTRNGNRTIPTGASYYTITWSNWKCLQGMVESYINTNAIGITTTGGQTTGLNGMTENGMYSGIYTDDYTLQSPTFVETFVLVVINDYAVSSQAGTPRRISQLKYATDTLTGQCTVKKRVGTGSDSIFWGDWEEISSLPDNINNTYTNIQIAPLKDFSEKSGSYYVINWHLKTATFTNYSGAAYTLAQALENNVTLKGAVYNYIKKFSPSFGDNTYAFIKIDQMHSKEGFYRIYGYFAEVVILEFNNVLASGKIFVHDNDDTSYTLLYETTETAL